MPGPKVEQRYKFIKVFEPLQWQIDPWNDTSPVLLLTGSAGGGKLAAVDTPVFTPSGWETMGEINIGDYVFDEHGKQTRVVAVSDIETPPVSYELSFDNGETIVACSEHRWLTYNKRARVSLRNEAKRLEKKGGEYYLEPRGNDQRYKMNRPSVVTTQEIYETLRTNDRRNELNHAIAIPDAVDLPEANLPLHPYVLGLWLAEGSSNSGQLTIASRDIDTILVNLSRFGIEVGIVKQEGRKKCYRVGMLKTASVLNEIGVLNNKHIPDIYMTASIEQRMWLLRGIIDGDGYVDTRGQVNIDLSNLLFINDVRSLVASLGVKVGSIRHRIVNLDGKDFDSWRFKFTTDKDVATVPFKRDRLKVGQTMRDTQNWVYITDCKPVASMPMKCIQVESQSHLYLLGRSFITSHNSRLAAEKIHGFMLRYPGSTGLILRKERSSMSNSTLVFMQREIIGKDPRVTHRPGYFRFEYDNGSILAYGGMKDDSQREAIRSIGISGGLDIVWMEEATHFTEQDFNEVIARMRGTAAPWSQIILTTNPDAPGHWINVRLILGNEASVYKSSAIDNRHNPKEYVEAKLNRLTGVQYKRLVLGEWAAGAGRVIDTWVDEYNPKTGEDHGGNVTEAAEYVPELGAVIWSIDDGYSGKMDTNTKMFTVSSHPRAFLLAQIRPDGIISIFAESVAIEKLATDHIRDVMKMCQDSNWHIPHYVVRDRAAASLEGALDNFGFKARYNQMTVDESIKELREWVAPDKNGVRRVLVHPRCFYTRYQMLTYSYDNDGRIIKGHDDTVDALRYLVWDQSYGFNPNIDIATIYSVAEAV